MNGRNTASSPGRVTVATTTGGAHGTPARARSCGRSGCTRRDRRHLGGLLRARNAGWEQPRTGRRVRRLTCVFGCDLADPRSDIRSVGVAGHGTGLACVGVHQARPTCPRTSSNRTAHSCLGAKVRNSSQSAVRTGPAYERSIRAPSSARHACSFGGSQLGWAFQRSGSVGARGRPLRRGSARRLDALIFDRAPGDELLVGLSVPEEVRVLNARAAEIAPLGRSVFFAGIVVLLGALVRRRPQSD